MQPPFERLESIHSMLAAGHRSVHFERHSLLLWGFVGGTLCLVTQSVVTAERFPVRNQQALALLAWLGLWIGGTGMLDFLLTRRARQERNETLPFAQAQITRAWWMLLTMGILGSFAMFFYGGGAMIYALWMVLLGLGVYLFGLFSRRLLEWVGLAIILLGVAGLASGLPFGMTRWLAASCFAIGLPLAGWIVSRFDDSRIWSRSLALVMWLFLVVGAPLSLAKTILSTAPPAAPVIPLSLFHRQPGEQVVHFPTGTVVHFRISLDSPLLSVPADKTLPLVLTRSVDIALKDGEPDGPYRLEGESWTKPQNGLLKLLIDKFEIKLENGTPTIVAHSSFVAKSEGK